MTLDQILATLNRFRLVHGGKLQVVVQNVEYCENTSSWSEPLVCLQSWGTEAPYVEIRKGDSVEFKK